jgi:hypothetical protein
MPDPTAVARALRGGPATLDALGARLGGPVREELAWALDEAVRGGLVATSEGGCGPDGVCSTAAPAVFRLTDAGRAHVAEAARAATRGR